MQFGFLLNKPIYILKRKNGLYNYHSSIHFSDLVAYNTLRTITKSISQQSASTKARYKVYYIEIERFSQLLTFEK